MKNITEMIQVLKREIAIAIACEAEFVGNFVVDYDGDEYSVAFTSDRTVEIEVNGEEAVLQQVPVEVLIDAHEFLSTPWNDPQYAYK